MTVISAGLDHDCTKDETNAHCDVCHVEALVWQIEKLAIALEQPYVNPLVVKVLRSAVDSDNCRCGCDWDTTS